MVKTIKRDKKRQKETTTNYLMISNYSREAKAYISKPELYKFKTANNTRDQFSIIK